MDKKLQDLAWSVLPKETRRSLISQYFDVSRVPFYADPTAFVKDGQKLALEMVFGHHNLTSDAEGEEMLTVKRKWVQEMYRNNCDEIRRENISSSDKDCYETVNEVLKTLFGSKCLPDEEESSANFCQVEGSATNVEGVQMSASTDSKFKAGDVAVVHGYEHPLLKHDGAIVTILSYHDKGDFYSCAIAPNVGIDVDAKYLEPYTEPIFQNPHENCDNGNRISNFGHIADDRNMVPSRLQIAAMAMQGILSNADRMKKYEHIATEPPCEDLTKIVARNALRYADALIKEELKGGVQ